MPAPAGVPPSEDRPTIISLPPPTPERIRARMLEEEELRKLEDSSNTLLLAKGERAPSPPRTPHRSKHLPISMPPPTPERIRAKEEEEEEEEEELQKMNGCDSLVSPPSPQKQIGGSPLHSPSLSSRSRRGPDGVAVKVRGSLSLEGPCGKACVVLVRVLPHILLLRYKLKILYYRVRNQFLYTF